MWVTRTSSLLLSKVPRFLDKPRKDHDIFTNQILT